jgi:hypothetical protein
MPPFAAWVTVLTRKIVIALPAKPMGPEPSEEQVTAIWQYWSSLVSPGAQAYLQERV